MAKTGNHGRLFCVSRDYRDWGGSWEQIYLGQCQEFCRYWPIETSTQRFPGCVFRGLSACTLMPHRERHPKGGSPLYNAEFRNQRAVSPHLTHVPSVRLWQPDNAHLLSRCVLTSHSQGIHTQNGSPPWLGFKHKWRRMRPQRSTTELPHYLWQFTLWEVCHDFITNQITEIETRLKQHLSFPLNQIRFN